MNFASLRWERECSLTIENKSAGAERRKFQPPSARHEKSTKAKV